MERDVPHPVTWSEPFHRDVNVGNLASLNRRGPVNSKISLFISCISHNLRARSMVYVEIIASATSTTIMQMSYISRGGKFWEGGV